MDALSAKVLGSIALVFGVVFVPTPVVRLTRPDLDLLLVLLNMALGILWVGAGVLALASWAPHAEGDR